MDFFKRGSSRNDAVASHGVWQSTEEPPCEPAPTTQSARSALENRDVARRFTWEIASISVHLEELRYFWAKALGISGAAMDDSNGSRGARSRRRSPGQRRL